MSKNTVIKKNADSRFELHTLLTAGHAVLQLIKQFRRIINKWIFMTGLDDYLKKKKYKHTHTSFWFKQFQHVWSCSWTQTAKINPFITPHSLKALKKLLCRCVVHVFICLWGNALYPMASDSIKHACTGPNNELRSHDQAICVLSQWLPVLMLDTLHSVWPC